MENQTKINIGLLIALIATWSYVGLEGLEPTHYCESREVTSHCFDLSSGDEPYRCYTNPTLTSWKTCSGGWDEIPENKVIEQKPVGSRRKWLCDVEKCTPIS